MNGCIEGSIKENGDKGIPKRISRSKILLVEGDNDYHFFKHFFLFEKINIDEIHIIRTCGAFDEDYANALVIRSDFEDNIKIFGIISEANTIGVQRTFKDGIFAPIGQNGWYHKNGHKASYDQQPVDAASMVQTLIVAYETTKENRYMKLAIETFYWFLGKNSLNQKFITI